jgi:hypothetical protein
MSEGYAGEGLDFLSDVSTGADDDPVEQAYRLIEEVLPYAGAAACSFFIRVLYLPP